MIHPVRGNAVNRVRVIATVINVFFVPFYSFHCNFAFTLPCFAFFLLILFVYLHLLFFRIQISYSVHHLLLLSPIL